MHEQLPWPQDATRDRLIGDWYFYQRKGGHRTSTDDALAAWFASHVCKDSIERYVDLGCGIGSVLLMVTHRLRPTRAVGLEAQAQSVQMARRSVEELPQDAPPLEIVHGDMRQPPEWSATLVTGSPPYFPVGTGVASPDPQRFACRFETRGGVEAYCQAAKTVMAPTGIFVLVYLARLIPRLEHAAQKHGLVETHRSLWKTRSDNAEPFLSVHAFQHADPYVTAPPRINLPTAAVREADGAYTPAYLHVRQELGLD